MSRSTTYSHAFAETFPAAPKAAILYVSLDFATTMHLCMCGCGEEVVAPLDPTDWTAHFDGRTVSLTPSIGSWSLQCQSHYFLTRGQVRWAQRWSKAQIAAARARDQRAKQCLDGTAEDVADAESPGTGRWSWLQRRSAKMRGRYRKITR